MARGRVLIDVAACQLIMRAHDKVEVFDVYRAFKIPSIYEELSSISVIDQIVELQLVMPDDLLERVSVGHKKKVKVAQEMDTCLNMASVEHHKQKVEPLERELGPSRKPFIEEASKLELKTLPSHRSYTFLGTNETLHVIFSVELSDIQVHAALRILKRIKKAIRMAYG